jgi:Sec-independent protein translocase protein TatA
MNFLGIGPLELVLFLLIALVVLGPDDIVKVSKKLGGWIRNVRKSDTWGNVVKMSDEVRKIPQNLMEETGIEDIKKDLTKTGEELKKDFVDIDEFNKELNRTKLDIEKTLGDKKIFNPDMNAGIKKDPEEK